MPKIKTETEEKEVKSGGSIIEACEEMGVPFGCSDGICGSCRIEIVEGEDNLTPLTEQEKEFNMDKKTRLACQCKIKKGDVKIQF